MIILIATPKGFAPKQKKKILLVVGEEDIFEKMVGWIVYPAEIWLECLLFRKPSCMTPDILSRVFCLNGVTQILKKNLNKAESKTY